MVSQYRVLTRNSINDIFINMIKKIVVLVFITFFFLAIHPVKAQENGNKIAPELNIIATAEYELPYPGMLPSSPLYKLKTLRDKVVLYLIRNPQLRAAKHLQLADRQLFEALKVAESGDIPLATHSAFKGEHQMTQMVDTLKSAVYSGEEMDLELTDKAHRASFRHQELLTGMKARTNDKSQIEQFNTIMEFSQRNNNELYILETEATDSSQQK